MKKLLCVFIILCLLPLTAMAEDWGYAISPLTLRNSDGYLTLANRDHLLDSDYTPEDLVNVTAKHVSGHFQLRKAAHEALLAMFAAAKEDGCTLYVKSAYRSYQTQNTMYYNRLKKNNGKDDGWVAEGRHELRFCQGRRSPVDGGALPRIRLCDPLSGGQGGNHRHPL